MSNWQLEKGDKGKKWIKLRERNRVAQYDRALIPVDGILRNLV